VLTSSSLSGKHDTVSSIQDGVGDIGALGTGRTRVGDHGLKHLGGSDNVLSSNVGLADHHLLGKEDLFRWDLHTEVTTGDHDGVSGLEDLIVVLKTLQVLNLADNLDVLSTILSEELTQVANIGTLTDEGSSDKINVVLNTELNNVVHVLLGKGGQVNDDSREVHVLALSDGGVVLNTASAFSSGNVARKDGQNEGTVGAKDLLSRGDRLWKSWVRACKLGGVSLERVVGGKDEGLSLDKVDLLSLGKETGADLRSLGIQKNGYEECGRVGTGEWG
jgi:hypothetical protein